MNNLAADISLKSVLKLFLAECRGVLGDDEISTMQNTLQKYSRDSAFLTFVPAAILYPVSVEQVRKIMFLAQKHAIILHTTSCGKNWGYGSASPYEDDAVILDLGRMNKIISFDPELAYVVVEPGVTQQQLFDHLQAVAPHLCMDVTGSTPDSSLIGNLAERGYGQTPYGDRFQHSSSMEVVLPNGELIKTSFARMQSSTSHHLYKWGLGPYVDGLFTQSNLGIIVSIGIWLMPRPENTDLLMMKIDSDEGLCEAISALRDLKMEGILNATVHISNDLRLISCFEQMNPRYIEAGIALPEDELRRLKSKWNFSKWNCFTSLRGSRAQISADMAQIRKYLPASVRTTQITKTSVVRSKYLGRFYEFFTGMSHSRVAMLYNLVSGKPSYGPTLGAFWRNLRPPTQQPPDPLRDECGFVWCAPVIPATSQHVGVFLKLLKRSLDSHGFETNLTLTMLSERALCCTIGIGYERSLEKARAEKCYEEIVEMMVQHGYIPYRHGINTRQFEEKLFSEADPLLNLCRKIKDAVDPNHILSPGKYGIW